MNKINFDITPQGPYFSVLRSAIWQTPVDTHAWPEAVDFAPIIDNFKAQAMLPVVSGVLMTLPEPYTLDQQTKDSILSCVAQNVRAHYNMRIAIVEVFTALENAGCHPILLKGEGLAELYPFPNYRTVGDIDLLVDKSEVSTAIETMKVFCGNNPDDDQHCDYEYQIYYGDISIEIHNEPSRCANEKYQQEYLDISKKCLKTELCEEVTINDKKILVPNKQFNIYYTFNHILYHWNVEIGLRQYIDVLYLLRKYFNEIKIEELLKWIESTGLTRAWNVTNEFLYKFVGSPTSKNVTTEDVSKKQLRFAVYTIVLSGNFGRNKDFNKYDWLHYFRCVRDIYIHTKRINLMFPEVSLTKKFIQNISKGFTHFLTKK